MEKTSRQRIELDKIQSKIIDEFADIVSQEINLSKTIVKGFYWKAIREWQKIYKKTLSETEQAKEVPLKNENCKPPKFLTSSEVRLKNPPVPIIKVLRWAYKKPLIIIWQFMQKGNT